MQKKIMQFQTMRVYEWKKTTAEEHVAEKNRPCAAAYLVGRLVNSWDLLNKTQTYARTIDISIVAFITELTCA